jgi:hypothetical protein
MKPTNRRNHMKEHDTPPKIHKRWQAHVVFRPDSRNSELLEDTFHFDTFVEFEETLESHPILGKYVWDDGVTNIMIGYTKKGLRA